METKNSGTSTFQQWQNFRSVLDDSRSEARQLIRSGAKASRNIIRTLEKQLPKPAEQVIFRRLGRHTQLCIQFQ